MHIENLAFLYSVWSFQFSAKYVLPPEHLNMLFILLGLLLNVKSQAAEMMMRALVSNWLLPQLVLEPTKRAILTLREVSR